MDDLIARLESASEGSRELDCDIGETVFNRARTGHVIERQAELDSHDSRNPNSEPELWQCRTGGSPIFDGLVPHYTTSVDVARSLIPDFKGHFGWRVSNWHEGKAGGGAWIDWSNDPVMSFADHHVNAHAATPALALCSVALKARRDQ